MEVGDMKLSEPRVKVPSLLFLGCGL